MAMIKDANQKDGWVEPLNIAQLLESFPIEELNEIKWITPIDGNIINQELQILIKDIFRGYDNSLVRTN